MRLRTLGIGIIATNVLVLTAWAHHSHGNYAMREFTEFDATVTEVYWINPHAWVYVEVEDEQGGKATWAIEAAGATQLTRAGIAEDDVKPGDRIHVKCHPLRDGDNGCLLGFVTTPDGVEKEWDN